MKIQENREKAVQELSAEFVVKGGNSYKEPRLIGEWVLWLEQRPGERGRTTALIRPFGKDAGPVQELTPSPINIKSRIHGYGGGAVAAIQKENELFVSWIDDRDQCLWSASWMDRKGKKNVPKDNYWLHKNHSPKRLSKPNNSTLGDGLVNLSNKCWIGIMEKNGKDFLVKFDLDKENQDPLIIYKASDFMGYLALHPNDKFLAWVEWCKPLMPWDASQLWIAELDENSHINKELPIAGTNTLKNNSNDISVFQPEWSVNGELFVAEDSNGWWNLIRSKISKENFQSCKWDRGWSTKAEAGMPQWVYGMRTIACTKRSVLAATCKEAEWKLIEYFKDGNTEEFKQPFTDIAWLNAKDNKAVAIASSSSINSGLLEIDLEKNDWHHTPSSSLKIEKDEISIPQPFWFNGYNNKPTHSWYYEPIYKKYAVPPLLVKSHSGPTSMAKNGLNLSIQFWTSRGWAVVDVNYGGSTGFGREYRNRLRYEWGKVDVYDCTAATKALIEAGKVNDDWIAIEGSSAGGFTTLGCLFSSSIFKVGACRYAVSDLLSMTEKTHRFEEFYLETLVGPINEKKDTYQERSPSNNADKIISPIVFFQGKKDKVVNEEQTISMVKELKKNKIPVELHTFKNEGHGFRSSTTQKEVLIKMEEFFIKHLNL